MDSTERRNSENESQKQLLFNSAHFCTRRKESLYTLFNFVLKYCLPFLFFFKSNFHLFELYNQAEDQHVAEKIEVKRGHLLLCSDVSAKIL